jgi:hypothetical protein
MLYFVGHAHVEKCQMFAEKVVRSFTKNKRYRPLPMGGMRIEESVPMQYAARISELAVALYLGLDTKALNWQTGTDGGYDILAPNGLRIDVKCSRSPYATRLIWPVTKTKQLEKDNFDILVFCKALDVNKNKLGHAVDIVGAITKQDFVAKAKKSFGNSGVIDGSLFFPAIGLDSIEAVMAQLDNIKKES